jgi:hypothetical protein
VITVPVKLGERSYDVVIGDGVRDLLADTLSSVIPGAGRVAVVSQAGIGVEVHPGLPHETFIVPDGEGAKSLPALA